MPTPSHNTMLRDADVAIENAQQVRAFHRKRTKKDSNQRQTDIRHASSRVQRAMKPIRTSLGRARHLPQSQEHLAAVDELKAASARLQAERRKLWKLRGGRKDEAPGGSTSGS
jgi:hypothetical protein